VAYRHPWCAGVDLKELLRTDVWVPGLLLWAALALGIRPLLVGVCLLPARLRRNEQVFVLFAGLKGAVPILLGSLLLAADVPSAHRLYGIVIVVVVFSVVVQGSLVPTVAQALRLPMRRVESQPWSLGVRLAEEPEGVLRLTVAKGSLAEGRTVDDVADRACGPGQSDDVWVNMLVRNRALVSVRGDTQLEAGDEVLVTADDRWQPRLEDLFRSPAP
jgi:potassium/hydrogen antiporter